MVVQDTAYMLHFLGEFPRNGRRTSMTIFVGHVEGEHTNKYFIDIYVD